MPLERPSLVELLRDSGCVAAEEEADELLLAAAGDQVALGVAVARRLQGEPLAWVCGTSEVAGLRLCVDRGVYVPRRWQAPAVAHHAAALLPRGGTAVDLCTGAGTVAALLRHGDAGARIVATDIDPAAVRCARRNGVDACEGSLFEPLPSDLRGAVDVVTTVAPYVPTGALPVLPRETLVHEPRRALDGGPDGLAVIRVVVEEAPRWLAVDGWLVLEHGADQLEGVRGLLGHGGWRDATPVRDREGEVCGVAARRPRGPALAGP